MRRIEDALHRLPLCATQLIENPVLNRLSEIGLKSLFEARLESIQSFEGSEHRILDEIRGVGKRTGPSGQAAVRPSLQPWQVALEERIEGRPVTSACTSEKLRGR
jgi:hypothetical protein